MTDMAPPRTPRSLVVAAVIAVGLGSAADALGQACAMCGSAFGADDPLGRAISWSILFLMAAPYAIVGTVAALLLFVHRRAAGGRRGAVIGLGRLWNTAAGQRNGGDVS